ncbi:DNA repair protein RecO [Virgibacillus siamensis]|uniref:DNA repair protein RecO n=1 Tax=Virgibacillus siamensis TaxID=480071 RepID=UPI000987455E|nr:DNA repair protein RecO [Virgibacillus siamensis]
MLEKMEGIVIRTQDYSETHKIVTIFSNKLGKISAIARGAKKPKSRMAAVTQPFILGEFFVYVGSGLSTIQQGEVINSFRPIREDIIKTAYTAYIAELTDKLTDTKSPDIYLYNQLLQTLNWIAEHDAVEVPMMMYELKVFAKGGFAPIVDRCVNCGGNKAPFSFSVTEGGLLCSRCRHMDPEAAVIPDKAAKLMRLFAGVGLERVSSISVKPENIQKIRQIIDAYYEQYGGYYLKSKKFLNQLDKL